MYDPDKQRFPRFMRNVSQNVTNDVTITCFHLLPEPVFRLTMRLFVIRTKVVDRLLLVMLFYNELP